MSSGRRNGQGKMVTEREHNALIERYNAKVDERNKMCGMYTDLEQKYNALLREVALMQAKAEYYQSIAEAWQKTLIALVDAMGEVKGVCVNEHSRGAETGG